MASKFSTGLRKHMLGVGSFQDAMTGAELRIFSGPVPATADAAQTGTLLATIKAGGTSGLNFGAPDDLAVISKDSTQVWMTNSVTASGDATYFRLVLPADTGADSITNLRAQGNIAKAGAEMNLGVTTFTAGLPWTLNFFNVALPTA